VHNEFEKQTENPEDEPLVDEVIDLETFAKDGKKPPRAKGYRFKINDAVFVWQSPFIKGREVLNLAALTPPDNFTLRVKRSGQKPAKVELDELVDLRTPGMEKFRAIRKEQTEGEYAGRRDAQLSIEDELFLDSYGLAYDVIIDGSTWIIIRDYPLPVGYSAERVSLAIRIEHGYPMTALDMMYVYPPINRTNGSTIPQVETMQSIEGKQYQRWSRHRTGSNPWIPHQDSIETHIYLIEEWIARELLR
jgi:hypothetical protein